MTFVFAAFLSPLFYAFACLIESQLSNRTFKHQTTMIFYISLMNCLFLPLLLFFGMPEIPSKELFFYYVLIAVIDVAYLYPYYTAMKVIDTSIVGALFSLGQITIPVMTYFFLEERLEFTQYIGFTIIIMASIALSIKGAKIPKLNRAFYYMVLASLLWALHIVMEKYVLNLDSNWINVTIYPTALAGLFPLLLLFRKKWRKDIKKNFPPYLHKFKYFVVNEFFDFIGMAASIYGLSGLSPVASASISATLPIFMLGISYLALKYLGVKLKERFSARYLMKKFFCFVLIILGVILVVR